MKTFLVRACGLAAVLGMAGCATPEVVGAGPQTYTVSAGGGLGWTPASGPQRTKVFKVANAYCAQRGLVMVPVSLDERPGEIGRHTAGVTLLFRGLRPGDPEIRRTPYHETQHEAPAGNAAPVVPLQFPTYQPRKSYHTTPDYMGGYYIREQ